MDLQPAVGAWRNFTRVWARWLPSKTPAEYLSSIIAKGDTPIGTLGAFEFSREEHWAPFDDGTLAATPALENAPFFRSFGSPLQAVAVKTPSYYASLYVGAPAGQWYVERREDKFVTEGSR